MIRRKKNFQPNNDNIKLTILESISNRDNFIRTAEYNKAIQATNDLLNKKINLTPDSKVKLFFGRGAAYKAIDKNEEALKDFIRVTEIIERNKIRQKDYNDDYLNKVYIVIAKLYLLDKNYTESNKYLDKVSKTGKNNIEYFKALESLYTESEQYEKAIDAINQVIQKDPNSAINYHNKGYIYFQLNDMQKARKNFELALSYNRDLLESKLMIIRFDIIDSNLQEASKALTELYKQNTKLLNSSIYLETRAKLEKAKGNYPSAIKYLKKARELDPKNISIQVELATIYLYEGKKKEFEEIYSNLKDMKLESFNFKLLECKYKYLYGQNQEYKALLGELKELRPNNISCLKLEVDFLIVDKSYEEAIDCINKALKLYPEHLFFLEKLGEAYLRNREFDKAKEIFFNLYETNPSNFIMQHLGDVYAFNSQPDKAIEYYLQIDENLRKTDINLLNNLGVSYYKMEKYDEAINCFKEVLKLDNKDYQICINLGKTYFEQGQNESAQKYFNQAITIEGLTQIILKPFLDEVSRLQEFEQNQQESNNLIQKEKERSAEKKLKLLKKLELKLYNQHSALEIGKQKSYLSWSEQYQDIDNSAICNLYWNGYPKQDSNVFGYIDKNSKEILKLDKTILDKAESTLREGKFTDRFQKQTGIKLYSSNIAVIKILGSSGAGDVRLWGEKI